MNRILVICGALCSGGVEPVPEAPWTLRVEETGFTSRAPHAPAPKVRDGARDPRDTLISATEIEIAPSRPFRVKSQLPGATRVVSGSLRPDPELKDRWVLRLDCSTELKDAEGLLTRRSIQTEVSIKAGTAVRIGGAQSETSEAGSSTLRSDNVWVTLRESED